MFTFLCGIGDVSGITACEAEDPADVFYMADDNQSNNYDSHFEINSVSADGTVGGVDAKWLAFADFLENPDHDLNDVMRNVDSWCGAKTASGVSAYGDFF